MDSAKRRNEFMQDLRNSVAKLAREDEDRIERTHVEEIGERYGLDPEESRRLFVNSRGDVWRGDLVGGDGESEWEAATLERVPSTTGDTGDDLSI